MKTEIIIGEERIINGEVYYSQGYVDDGCSFGYIYKSHKAFYGNPNDICYIPEYGFSDAPFIEVDGERFYNIDDLSAYSRNDLEVLVMDETDEEGNPIDVEAFFNSLMWCFPETRLLELSY